MKKDNLFDKAADLKTYELAIDCASSGNGYKLEILKTADRFRRFLSGLCSSSVSPDLDRRVKTLILEDVIFLNYDKKRKKVIMWLLMSDTFGYACADTEDADESDIDMIYLLYQRFNQDGLTAWASYKRKTEPIKELQTKEYFDAKYCLETYYLEQ